jgi:CMP/dCMP kinase
MIIAVDGPTASGKGTIALALAKHFDLPHLDTGLLYRAVAWKLRVDGGDPDNPADALAACDFDHDALEEPDLRSEMIGGLASRVSVHPGVREALFKRQRAFATLPGGAVLDGRDIGTVIAPDADAKLFITASVDARAKRRFLEMSEAGYATELAEVAAYIETRDARDTNRKDAPLRAAEDAMVLDTSDLSIDDAISAAIALVKTRTR